MTKKPPPSDKTNNVSNTSFTEEQKKHDENMVDMAARSMLQLGSHEKDVDEVKDILSDIDGLEGNKNDENVEHQFRSKKLGKKGNNRKEKQCNKKKKSQRPTIAFTTRGTT